MTKEEWKTRFAAQYMKRTGLTQEQANAVAEVNFESQDGDFSELVDYNPEQCADDDDMDCWTDAADEIERLRALASAQAARAVSAEFERDALQAEYERGRSDVATEIESLEWLRDRVEHGRAQDAEPLPTTQMRAYGTACAAAEREACQHIADWEPTREAIQSAIRARGAVTMGEMYGDGSAHEACQSCGMCLRCGDCICAPNVGDERRR